jgi:hypothetical protein
MADWRNIVVAVVRVLATAFPVPVWTDRAQVSNWLERLKDPLVDLIVSVAMVLSGPLCGAAPTRQEVMDCLAQEMARQNVSALPGWLVQLIITLLTVLLPLLRRGGSTA